MKFDRIETWDDLVTIPRTSGGQCTVLHRITWGWGEGRWHRISAAIIAPPALVMRIRDARP